MSTIVTRTVKGSALTWAEADANFDNLNNDKLEKSGGLMTGALGVIAGSVASPGLYGSGDTDTGVWFPAANTLAASVGGAEILRLAANQVSITGGTITSVKPGLLVTNTWNNSSTQFEGGLRVDITDTASFSASRIILARVGGADKFFVDKYGAITSNSSLYVGRGPSQVTNNIVIGSQALNRAAATGGASVIIGQRAAFDSESTIGGNVAIGEDALRGTGSGVAATGSVNLTAGNAADGDTAVINGKTYTWQTTLTNVDGNVLIGASATASILNLKNAITLGTGSGTTYAAATTAHTTVTASASTTTCTVTALTVGTGGNAYTLAVTGTNPARSAATLAGGTALNTSYYSVALGYSALGAIRNGAQNMAIGPFALLVNEAGNNSCAIGYSSMIANLGNANTGVGSFSCQNGTAANENNVGIGYAAAAGASGATGYENVAIGKNALQVYTTGIRNTCLGSQAGDLITTGNRNIVIGYNCDPASATTSDSLNIGNLIKGDLTGNVITAVGDIRPEADGTRNLGSGALRFNTVYATTGSINTSDERLKVIREGGDLNAAELAAWARVRPFVYQSKASVDEWGKAARLHVGYGWDIIRKAFEAEGLDPARYGLWCSDPVMEKRVRVETSQRQKIGEDGQPVTELQPIPLGEGKFAMVDRCEVVIDMVPTETPVMETYVETYLEIEDVEGVKVAVAKTRDSERQATERLPVLLEDGSPAMTDAVGVEGEDGYKPAEPITITIPKTVLVDMPVEREVITQVPHLHEMPVYEDVEYEVEELVPTGEVSGSLRYSECAVFEAAWLRHQLAALTARVEALEAL